MESSRYLFVLKDPSSTSLSKSDDREKRLIQRHVQIGSLHRRQLPPNSTSAPPFPIIEVQPGTKKDHRRKSRVSTPTTTTPTESKLELLLVKERSPCCCLSSQSRISRPECPVHAVPRMSTDEEHIFDPFASTVANVDRLAHSLLQYFVNVSHPRTWHSESRALPDKSYTFQKDALTLVRESLHNEVHLYTLLASMASQLQNFEHADQYRDRTSTLIHKAITAIRNHIRISGKIDQRFIFDIHQMAVTEFYRFELQSSLIHLRAVRSLVVELGGLEKIEPSLREWIVIGDGFVAAELLQRPVFSASGFDPGRWNQSPKEVDGETLAGMAFQETKYDSIFSKQMRDILFDMMDCYGAMKRHLGSAASSQSPSSKAIAHWLLLRVTAIRHRLLDLDAQGICNPIRIALIIWLFLVTTVTGRRRTVKILACKLRIVLVQSAKEAWAGYEDTLLWISLLGAMSAEGDDREGFLNLIRDNKHSQTRILDAGVDEDEMERSSISFFYLEKVQRPMLRELAEQLRHDVD